MESGLKSDAEAIFYVKMERGDCLLVVEDVKFGLISYCEVFFTVSTVTARRMHCSYRYTTKSRTLCSQENCTVCIPKVMVRVHTAPATVL